MDIVITIGNSIIGIFITFILLKKEKNSHDYWLILTNLVLAGILLSNLLIKTKLTLATYLFNAILPYWIFPVFITYGLLLITEKQILKPTWIWIYSYAISFTLLNLIDLSFTDTITHDTLDTLFRSPPLIYHVFYKSHSIFVIVANFWFLRKIKFYRLSIKKQYSFIEPIRLQWLVNFSWIMIGLYSLVLTAFLIYNLGYIANIDTVFLILSNAIVVAVLYSSYYGIKQYSFVQFQAQFDQAQSQNPKPATLPKVRLPSKTKYATSALDDAKIQLIFRDLNALFEEDALYQEPQLKISEVATRLNVSPHQLSQVINSQFGNSFFEFVNTFRVEALQKKLRNPANKRYTILALAYDCGFNSKASLNRIFKKQTNQTPSQYQKIQLAD